MITVNVCMPSQTQISKQQLHTAQVTRTRDKTIYSPFLRQGRLVVLLLVAFATLRDETERSLPNRITVFPSRLCNPRREYRVEAAACAYVCIAAYSLNSSVHAPRSSILNNSQSTSTPCCPKIFLISAAIPWAHKEAVC